MCGIAGFVNLGLGPGEGRVLLERMCGEIRHRGPDDEGYFGDDRAGLGMRRLSIIDLAGGRQPMKGAGGDHVLVYNGEVYNYRRLRRELEGKGHRFTTDSDTEVVLRQFEESGEPSVEGLNGMFAFALWDRRRRTLVLARDRMGIKPLYYFWDGRKFLFASEIKALIASGHVPRRLNLKAIWDYLTFRYVPPPETVWQGVFKVPPGHTLTLAADASRLRLRRYWDIPYGGETPAGTMEEYAGQFEELFLDAVRSHLAADVPVGILLSGGLDSSAVAAAVAEVRSPGLESFTVAFRGAPSIDERPWARDAAARTGAEHREVLVGEEEVRSFLPRLVRITDEPLADPAAIPLYFVSELARRRVKVVLSGEGGDEVLGGYNLDLACRHWEMMRRFQRLPRSLREGVLARCAPLLGPRAAAMVEKANTPLDRLLLRHPPAMADYAGSAEKRLLLKKEAPFPDSLDVVRREVAASGTGEPLHQALYSYCQSWLVEDLLMKADKMTMAASLELRVPFLDHRLVEWAARTPPWVKVGREGGGFLTKRVLRRFGRGRLPEAILSRPKQGFPVPVYQWLAGGLRPWAWEVLAPGSGALLELFRPREVEERLRRGTAAGTPPEAGKKLWHLIVLEFWLREWRPEVP